MRGLDPGVSSPSPRLYCAGDLLLSLNNFSSCFMLIFLPVFRGLTVYLILIVQPGYYAD